MNMDFIRHNWPIIAALFVGAAAWGQTQQKVTTLETAVIKIKEQDDKIGAVKEQAVRNEEQLKAIRAQLDKQEKFLQALVEANTTARRTLERAR